MKYASLNIIITGLLLAGSSAFGFDGYPQADHLEPRIAKVGTVLTVTGTALAKNRVEEVYLTDHRFDMKVKVLEQSETSLKIRIPPFAKPGRLQLLFLTSGEKPAYLEQPLYVQVEEGDVEPAVAPVEVTKKAANTVEVASIGTSIPVPPLNAAPEPNIQKPQPSQSAAITPTPAPVATVPTPVKREETQPKVAPVPVPPAPVQPQQVPAEQPQAAPAARTVTPPRLIKRTPVAMPSNAAALGNDSTVELQLHIRTDGRVGNVKVVKGNPLFAQVAMRSVRDWVYESAYVGSTPVETDVTVILNFKR